MNNLLYKDLSYNIIGAAIEVHRILGPGFLESVYQKALAHEFSLRGIPFQEQVHLPVTYKAVLVGDYIADFVIEDKIILELKAISKLGNSHKAQAVNYPAATGYQLAILINFGESTLHQQRIVLATDTFH